MLLAGESRIRVEVPTHQDAAAAIALSSVRFQRLAPGRFQVVADAGHLVCELLFACHIYPDTVAAERVTLEERFFEVTDHGGAR